MNRLPDWEARYAHGIETVRFVPFTWGVHDCVMFAAYMIERVTGRDFSPEFRRKYRWADAQEAKAIVAGAGGLGALVDEFLGVAARRPPLLLAKGDVVLAHSINGIEVLAVHDGARLIAPAPDVGLDTLPLGNALYGWRLG